MDTTEWRFSTCRPTRTAALTAPLPPPKRPCGPSTTRSFAASSTRRASPPICDLPLHRGLSFPGGIWIRGAGRYCKRLRQRGIQAPVQFVVCFGENLGHKRESRTSSRSIVTKKMVSAVNPNPRHFVWEGRVRREDSSEQDRRQGMRSGMVSLYGQ